MSVRMKVWLWFALILGIATTCLNASYGRWSSVAIAVGSIAGLCVMLFAKKKWGFYLMCACYLISFIIGVYGGITGGTNVLVSIVMSFIGSILTPGITFLFMRKEPTFTTVKN